MNREISFNPFLVFEQEKIDSIGKYEKIVVFDFHFERKYPIIFQILY